MTNKTTLRRAGRLTGLLAAACILSACVTNSAELADPPQPTSTPVTTTQPTISPNPTKPTALYDETQRTPLNELSQRLTDTVARQGGNTTANQCVATQILNAYETGKLTPTDLDEYIRNATITPQMTAILQQLQTTNTCIPTSN